MNHDSAVREQMTEKYLLNELNSDLRKEFEEHFFDCPDCAFDVRAAALLVEHGKAILAENAAPAKPGWWSRLYELTRFRPVFAVPVMAVLLLVVGYQNLVTYPHLRQAATTPQVLPWAQVNIGTWGSASPVITTRPNEGFLLFVRIPPDGSYSSYNAELYNAAGKLEWLLPIPALSAQDQKGNNNTNSNNDQWPLQVPAANREAGSYNLVIRGVTTSGESREVGRASFELQIQN